VRKETTPIHVATCKQGDSEKRAYTGLCETPLLKFINDHHIPNCSELLSDVRLVSVISLTSFLCCCPPYVFLPGGNTSPHEGPRC